MKVCVRPIPDGLSQAMFRVAQALVETAPPEVQIVGDPKACDLHVVHTIGLVGMETVTAKEIAVIQYMLFSADGNTEAWHALWRKAKLVWSYYDIKVPSGVRFLHTPLGVDGLTFRLPIDGLARPYSIMTSGYLNGPGAEAIEEVAEAANRLHQTVVHLGPAEVKNMVPRTNRFWQAHSNLSDQQLNRLYGQCRWVSGLRRIEGFELPVLEGLACGARPIVFDRPDMHHWYDGHAVFVPELEGEALVEVLQDVLSQAPKPVTVEERTEVLRKFNWFDIGTEFWEKLLA